MGKLIGKKSRILIKTYTFESGLWYLAKSLCDRLVKEGHIVAYIPKSKYVREGSRFTRKYLKQKNKSDFILEPIFDFSENLSVVDQVKAEVIRFKADYVISMETLIEKSRWVQIVKGRTGVKVIDVPMLEWVTPAYVHHGYKIFDEVWALTDMTYDAMNEHCNCRRVSWDYVDRKLFYPAENKTLPCEDVRFYHAASLNPEFSSKNTEKVIHAFDKFLERNPKCELWITGEIKDYNVRKVVDKHTNIVLLDKAISRKRLANLYRNVDCVIAPSSKEGLGLGFFESEACGCELITTDAPPMNDHDTPYLCKPEVLKKDKTFVPSAVLSSEEIYKQIDRAYKDITCQKQK